jgi:tetratricopeptide (TPR) repeat protein
LRPDSPGAHLNLGLALKAGGQLDEAIACYRRAIDLHPNYVAAHCNLGGALLMAQRPDEAIACFRQAIKLEPKNATAHFSLGNGLLGKGRLDDAIACYHQAIHLEPKNVSAHCNLGHALAEKNRLDAAIACYRLAIDLDPMDAEAHYNLGHVLRSKDQVDEAIASYRKAITFNPKLAPAHVNLGNVLLGKGRLDEAITCYRQAIAFDRGLAQAHLNLGAALIGKDRFDEAIASLGRAIDLDPKEALAHLNLGFALRSKGDFRAALAALRTGHALGSQQIGRPYPSAELVKECERYVQLDDLLAAIRKGRARPAGPAECLELADFCRDRKQWPATAVRFYSEAFTTQPKLAADLQASHRFHAAQAAALAGCDQGQDTTGLSGAERTRLRRQALKWLRQDLALWTKQLETSSPQERQAVAARMKEWLSEASVAGVRDAAGLAELPAEERRLWQAFWANVVAARTKDVKAQEPPARQPARRPEK